VLQSRKNLAREIDIMKSVNHPNIIKLKDTFQDTGRLYLVMEFAVGGELFDRTTEESGEEGLYGDPGVPFTEEQGRNCMGQIFKAISYCHSLNICIRDLTPKKIVCMTKDPIDKVVLKLADFGLSKRFLPGVQMTTKLGAPHYMAPEMILAGKYDASCDLWSCGVIMYHLMTGYLPFEGETDAAVLERVKEGLFSFERRYPTDPAKNVIRCCFKFIPGERHTADKVMAEKWFKQ